MFFASSPPALLPSAARGVSGSAASYGVLLSSFGCGAVLGAVHIRARARWSASWLCRPVSSVSASPQSHGAASCDVGVQRLCWSAASVGVIHVAFQCSGLNDSPDWRAPGLRCRCWYFREPLPPQCGMGVIAAKDEVGKARVRAGVGAILTPSLAFFMPLSDTTVDLTAWNHWRMPSVSNDIGSEGPVLVIVEYDVIPRTSRGIHQSDARIWTYSAARRRIPMGSIQAFETADSYTEIFIVSSWQEHIRQHDRITWADSRFEGPFATACESSDSAAPAPTRSRFPLTEQLVPGRGRQSIPIVFPARDPVTVKRLSQVVQRLSKSGPARGV